MFLNAELCHEVEQFLYMEAALLDEHRYTEWFELFTEDCHYWMPVRQTRLARQEDAEFSQQGEIAFFDEGRAELEKRVRKLESPYAWGQSPAPRTRHMCTNVRIAEVHDDEITVNCNFLFYRCSLEVEEDYFVGRREDVLRKVDQGFRIARRTILLDQTVITAKNMNHFF
ncbi:aromatic-ring-hydroxylating dioxygenase subunit beta [Sphingobium estronivorans]|uniref:aromatic-ring-hydroxylating dioxygenase subunit beta n=1 Tax=Sphingobium estronivorans TaxID=1577690 RepID=UPI00123B078E|nr:3-phenylpropionate/cinnamic acid dioxygenase subunit beta [Sphingobium estronivorans]